MTMASRVCEGRVAVISGPSVRLDFLSGGGAASGSVLDGRGGRCWPAGLVSLVELVVRRCESWAWTGLVTPARWPGLSPPSQSRLRCLGCPVAEVLEVEGPPG